MIYMRGLKANDLVAIVDFIYHGEASIYQEDLNGFLALAEELQLKGLAGSQEDTFDAAENLVDKTHPKPSKRGPTPKQEHYFKPHATEDNDGIVEIHPIVPVDAPKKLLATDTSKEDLKVEIESMMKRADDEENKWKCTVCGKVIKHTRDMRRHIESHIEGLSYPCNQCDTVSRSGEALRMHVITHHRK